MGRREGGRGERGKSERGKTHMKTDGTTAREGRLQVVCFYYKTSGVNLQQPS